MLQFRQNSPDYALALSDIALKYPTIDPKVRKQAQVTLSNLIRDPDYKFPPEVFKTLISDAANNLGRPDKELRSTACKILTTVLEQNGIQNEWNLFSKIINIIKDTDTALLEASLNIYFDVLTSGLAKYTPEQRERCVLLNP